MAVDRKALSTTTDVKRRPAATIQRSAAPAPATPSPARALQQRLGIQGTQALMQREAATLESKKEVGSQRTVSSEVVDVSSGTFNPSEQVKGEIEAQGLQGLMVRVVATGLTTEGQVKTRADRSHQYDSIEKGSMPLLNPWMQQLGGMYLNFAIKNNVVVGYAALKPHGGDINDWLEAVKKNSSLLGGLGLKVQNLPKPVNKFEGGKLMLGVTNLNVEVGGFIDAKFNLLLENANQPKIDATANVNIKGMTKGTLTLDNSKEALAGQVSLAIDFKAFSGSALVKYAADGTVDVSGKAAYNADKLSGEIEFVATDLDAANKFAKDAIGAAGGKENVQDAPPPAPVPMPKPEKKHRALAATGQLNFNLTQWFAGAVNVVVDGNGKVTVIGKIAPPAEILLFPQKSWDKELIKFEAKAYYGIPVVGNLNLFANISLHALAMLGPAKIYKIEVLGTYSTDPEIQKNIQISGSINISAFAGLRLRAEGGAGIEILDHDLKFGIGVNADVGVKAYAEARPTFGFRDPGEFYISGTLEMVAQPMLGLSGEFFIEIETPWWSPLSDDRWPWPLFSKEWPLSDPIGINAVVKDYVLGSGNVPEIELKKPEFDPSKFMTSMVDNKLPNKTGGPGTGQGTFKDDGSVPKPVVLPKKPAPPKPGAKHPKKAALAGGKSAKPDPKAQSDQAATQALKSGLDSLKKNEPYSKAELTKALGVLKTKVKGVSFNSKPQGDKWIITAGGGGKKKSAGQQIELKMKKEGAVSDEAQKALTALDQVTERYAAKGATLEEMTAAIKSVRRKFKFKSLTVEQKAGFWYFNYELSPKGARKGPQAAKVVSAKAPLVVGDKVRRRDETWSNGEVTSITEKEIGGLKTKWVNITLRKSKSSKEVKDGSGYEKVQQVVPIEKLLKDFASSPESLARGEYARGYSASIPEHSKYEPKSLKETKLKGGGLGIEYETFGGAKFVASIDSAKLTHTISGTKLRLKEDLKIEGRGITHDSPGFIGGVNLNRSHLIADRFLGSGYKKAANLVTASAEFNQVTMKGIEDQIVRLIELNLAKEFALTVTVQLGELKKADIVQQILNGLPKAEQGAVKASVEQFASRHPKFKVILDVNYLVTLVNAETNKGFTVSLSTGPDKYLKV